MGTSRFFFPGIISVCFYYSDRIPDIPSYPPHTGFMPQKSRYLQRGSTCQGWPKSLVLSSLPGEATALESSPGFYCRARGGRGGEVLGQLLPPLLPSLLGQQTHLPKDPPPIPVHLPCEVYSQACPSFSSGKCPAPRSDLLHSSCVPVLLRRLQRAVLFDRTTKQSWKRTQDSASASKSLKKNINSYFSFPKQKTSFLPWTLPLTNKISPELGGIWS